MHNLPNNNETNIIRNIFSTSVKLHESPQMRQPPRGAPAPGDVYSEEGILQGAKELGKMVGSMFDMSDDPSQLSRQQRNPDYIKRLAQDPRNMPNLLRTGQVERSIVNEPAPAPDKNGISTRRYYVPAGVDPKTADPDQPIRVPADTAASEQAKLVNKNSESPAQAPQTSQAPQSKPGLQLKPTSSYTTGASTETNAPLTTKMSPTSPTGAVSPDTKWQPSQSTPSQPKKSMDDVMKSVMDIINKPSTPNKSLGGLGDAFGMGTTDALRNRTDAAVNKFGSPAPAAKPVNKSLGGLGDAFGMGTTDALRNRTDAAVNQFAGSPSSKPAAPTAPAAKPAAKPAPVATKPTSSQSPFEAPPEPDQQPRSKRLPVGPQTTSGRQTGLGANQTAFQPTQSWEDVAKKNIPDQFKNMPLSRKNGKVYAGDVEMTAASQETSQYADNAPRKPISEVYYRRLASLFENNDRLDIASAKRRERQVQVAGLEGQVNPHGFENLAQGIRNVQAFSGMGGADMPKTPVEKPSENVGERTVAKADQRKALMAIMSASQDHADLKDRFTKEDALNPNSPLHKMLVSRNPGLQDESQVMAKYYTS